MKYTDEICKLNLDNFALKAYEKGKGIHILNQDLFEMIVSFIISANNVKELPAELLRKGRFDEMFFVDLPNKGERKEIIELYLGRYLGVTAEPQFVSNLVKLTENFTGSDIESILRDLAYQSIAGVVEISEETVLEAFNKSVSMYQTNKEKIESIREWAKDRTIHASKKDEVVEEKPVPTEPTLNETTPTVETLA